MKGIILAGGSHFIYKCTAEYAPEAEVGVRWDDPDIGVAWPQVSERDRDLPFLKDAL